MLIKKAINILLQLGATPDIDAVKLIELYQDAHIRFVKNYQNNIFYKS